MNKFSCAVLLGWCLISTPARAQGLPNAADFVKYAEGVDEKTGQKIILSLSKADLEKEKSNGLDQKIVWESDAYQDGNFRQFKIEVLCSRRVFRFLAFKDIGRNGGIRGTGDGIFSLGSDPDFLAVQAGTIGERRFQIICG